MTSYKIAAWASALLLAAPAAAQEQPTAISVQRFVPTTGHGDFFAVETDKLLSAFKVAFGLYANFSDDPLVAQPSQRAGDEIRIIDSQLTFDALMGVGLSDRIELDLGLPITASQRGDDLAALGVPGLSAPLKSSGLGDLRVVTKVRLLGDGKQGLGVVLLPGVSLPTGDKSNFLSQGASLHPGVAVAYRVLSYSFALNLSYDALPRRQLGDLVVDDQIGFGAAAYAPVIKGAQPLGVVTELTGGVGLMGDGGAAERPLEARAGLRFSPSRSISLTGGLGTGLSSGFGEPDFRAFASFTWLQASNLDSDKDGIFDSADRCVKEPEDKDGFQDDDGCPDNDNDKDGVADASDKCPNQAGPAAYGGCPVPDQDKDGVADNDDKCPTDPEDKDSFEDQDGCPDPDNDKDAIADKDDKCPLDPEDKDSFEDQDGCPEADNDGDGFADAADKCPNDAEDKDSFQDEDGCPDLDNDKDGIADASDKCPNEAETFNGEADDDGCPDAPATASLTDTGVEIKEKVQFESGSDKILPASYKLLDGVAAILKLHSEVTKLRVEGHTDNKGTRAYNVDLSQRRAASVLKYLNDKGVDSGRLVSKGYGPDVPVDVNTTPAGRAKNRRVEFVIIERNGVAVVPTKLEPTTKPAGTKPVVKKPTVKKPEVTKPTPPPAGVPIPVPIRKPKPK